MPLPSKCEGWANPLMCDEHKRNANGYWVQLWCVEKTESLSQLNPFKKNNHRKKSHRKKILQIEIPTAQLLNFSWLFPENELPMATPKNRMSEWKILRFPSYQQKQPRLHRHPHHGLLQRTWNDWGWTPSLATVLCHFSDLIHGMQIPSGND